MARTTRISLAKYLIKIDDIYPAMLDGPEKIRPIIFSRFLFLLRPFFQRAPRLVSWTDSRLSFEWASKYFLFFLMHESDFFWLVTGNLLGYG